MATKEIARSNGAGTIGAVPSISLWAFLLLLIAAFGLAGCGDGQSTLSPPPGTLNPVPTVTSLSPSNTPAGGPTFTLTVTGTNFVNGSVVHWNGDSRTTTFVSNTQLNASITATDIAVPGTAFVGVLNPAPGGGFSNEVTFTITAPAPTLTGISPANAVAGAAPITLTATGSGFIGLSVVRWNGADRPTTFVSGTELMATIPASDLAAAGAAQVTVFNPAPGGGTSGAAAFTIDPLVSNPVPVAASISPSTVPVGVSGFPVTVDGSDFVAASVGQWNGSDRGTTVVSGTQLRAGVRLADTELAGNASVAVFTPAPGGGTSASLNVTIAPAAGAVGVVDRPSVPDDQAEADLSSGSPAISGDGRFVAFSSAATNLVAGDTNGFNDVFLRDTCRGAVACTPSTIRVSVASDGTEANSGSFGPPSISPDGRFVAFASAANNLVPGDTNGLPDVFLRDTCIGAVACTPSTIRISVASDGTQASGGSGTPSVSATGRFVVFPSPTTNLVAGDTNSATDVFLRDTCIGAAGCTPSTIRVSVASDGTQGNSASLDPSLSADGRFVAFQSNASNLVNGDTNNTDDIFLRDTCIGALACTPSTVRVSVGAAGAQSVGFSFLPRISANGRFVVFSSFGSDLVPGDMGTGHDVFAFDSCFGALGCTPSTTRVSVSATGGEPDAPNGGPATGGASISADGRFVAYGSRATNLVAGDTNGTFDIFVRDTCVNAVGCTPSTLRVSVALDGGTQASDRSDLPAISADGRFVAFQSCDTGLLPADENNSCDVFLARTDVP